jgi:hypothetical protein
VTEPLSLADLTRAVLLAVRLRAVATTDDLYASLAYAFATVDDLDGLLRQLERAGLVEHRDGSFPGWRLTADGRAEGERLLAVELTERDVRSAVTAAYERFLAHNGPLLRVVTDWQLVDANPSSLVVNDHGDAAYDAAVIERLRTIHRAVLPICTSLASALPRFSVYGPRFDDALDRIGSGDGSAFDGGDVDSYHHVWFELHDHLLATLGIDRSTEPLPDA